MLALFGNLERAGLPPSFVEELAWRLFHNHPTAACRALQAGANRHIPKDRYQTGTLILISLDAAAGGAVACP